MLGYVSMLLLAGALGRCLSLPNVIWRESLLHNPGVISDWRAELATPQGGKMHKPIPSFVPVIESASWKRDSFLPGYVSHSVRFLLHLQNASTARACHTSFEKSKKFCNEADSSEVPDLLLAGDVGV